MLSFANRRQGLHDSERDLLVRHVVLALTEDASMVSAPGLRRALRKYARRFSSQRLFRRVGEPISLHARQKACVQVVRKTIELVDIAFAVGHMHTAFGQGNSPAKDVGN